MIQLKKDKGFIILIGILCFLFGVVCNSDCVEAKQNKKMSYVVTLYNEQNGLPTGEANTVLQTSDGYIWIGSYGGLVRYDGTAFRNYSVERAIKSSSIRALFEDSKGRLWIGTNDAGVVVMEQDTFTEIALPEDRSFACIRDFAEGEDGTIYVASNSGMAEIKDGKIVPYEAEEIIGNTVYTVAVDSYGRVWGSMNNGDCAIVKDGKLLEVFTSDIVFDNFDIYSIDSNKNGDIVMGTSDNVVAILSFETDSLKKQDLSVTYYGTGEVTVHNAISATKNGYILVSGINGFAVLDSKGNLTEFGEDENAMSVNAAIADYENNIWLASSSYGMIKYSQGCFTTPNEEAKLDGIAINAIVNHKGSWYVGHDTGLIVCDSYWKPVANDLTQLFDDVRIRCIIKDSQGNLWIASYSDYALVCYNPATEEIHKYGMEDGLAGDKARVVTELSDGRIVVGTQTGISILKEGKIEESYNHEDGLDNPSVLCFSEGLKGELLIGSDGDGIYQIADGKVTHYGYEEGLEEGVVLRMLKDTDQDGWFVSAGSSLYYWQDGEFQVLTNFVKDAGSVFDFYDKDGMLWLIQNSGVIALNKKQLLSGKDTDTIHYGLGHGMTGSINANTWNYLSDDDMLYMTTRNGISVFGFAGVDNSLPKVMVHRIMVDDQIYEHPDTIQIDGSSQRITFDFSALSYTDTTELRIGYQLKGFDKESFVASDKSGSVSYTNLPGGDYEFEVWAYNPENPKDVVKVTLPVQKPKQITEYLMFWIMMVIVIVLICSIAIMAFARMKMNALHRRQQEYKSIVEQSLRTFAKTIDAKDSYTNGHSTRVAAYSRELAKRMNMSEAEQENIYYIALLHDIGKIGVPDDILNKKGILTEEEMDIVRKHVDIGGEILADFTAIENITEGAKYHHERYDGKGYTEGLSQEEIPQIARIIGVADSYDAMSSDRCYRKALPNDVIVEELRAHSGSQFDPEVVPHMLAMIEEGIVPMKEE